MVRAGSTITSLADLRGKRIGLGAPMATAATLVARDMLRQAGLRLGTDLACRNFDQHEGAARACLLGEVDACAVRDIVGVKFLTHGLRVLAQSDPLPNFPLVVAASGLPFLKDQLERALVTIPAADHRAQETIVSWDEELAGGFALATEAEYEPIHALAIRVLGPRAMTIPEGEARCGGGGK